ncbi:hypothetical protein J6590_073296 [Homalodisca vitripennis]|nr:hypothetical protein J6590_073296 [Homalodisca vitripennis]
MNSGQSVHALNSAWSSGQPVHAVNSGKLAIQPPRPFTVQTCRTRVRLMVHINHFPSVPVSLTYSVVQRPHRTRTGVSGGREVCICDSNNTRHYRGSDRKLWGNPIPRQSFRVFRLARQRILSRAV